MPARRLGPTSADSADDARASRPDPRALEALERYLEHLRAVRRRSPHTIRNYRSDATAFLAHLAKLGVLFEEAGRSDVRSHLSALRMAEVAPASIRRAATTIKAFFKWLDREGMLQPARRGDSILALRYPKAPKRLPHFLSIDEAERIIETADDGTPRGQRNRALLELLYGAGLRVSEAAALDVGDLDLANLQVRVLGKGDKTRISLFGEPARLAITRYLDEGRIALASAQGHVEPALFLGNAGRRLSVRAMQDVVRRAGLQAAISERVHPHLLRHTFATHMLEGDADLRIVQQLLGHASADTTQVYTAVTQRRRETVVANALERAREVERGAADGSPDTNDKRSG